MRLRREFDAAHHIEGHPGRCARLHGHTYTTEFVFLYPQLDRLGMGADFGVLKDAVDGLLEAFDHHDVNEVLRPEPATVENLARHLFEGVVAMDLPVVEVTVWEGRGGGCTYRPEENRDENRHA